MRGGANRENWKRHVRDDCLCQIIRPPGRRQNSSSAARRPIRGR
jgi:hypothetical protein